MFSAKNTAKLQSQKSVSMVISKKKKVKQKRKKRHQDRNQVIDVPVGKRERNMVIVLGAPGELQNIDMGQTAGDWKDKVKCPSQRDLRQVTMSLAMVIPGVVAKRDVVQALEGWKKEASHMVDSIGNLVRNRKLELSQRAQKRNIMVLCHMD